MLSIPHLVIIFLIALIVLGPEKLPQVARLLGKAMADFRRITTDFRVQIEDEMREMERHTRMQQMTAGPSPFTPSDQELLGATPATMEPATPPATLEPVAAPPDPSPSAPAPASAPEKPADGQSQPA
jgi:sec-independent protein translocase protein TatB